VVRQLPGVVSVQPNFKRYLHTDAGPAWIGAPGIWDGTQTGGLPGTMGEGIIVGVIDTGINPSNPSFADIGGDGYDHTNPLGNGNYVGVCNPAEASYDPTFPCNDKLIGAWGHVNSGVGSPVDDNGHGSHTASTAAGNVVTAEVVAPTVTQNVPISGVAPHANIIAYDACAGSGCDGASLAYAIDRAIADGVDVINYSIGSTAPSLLWSDFDTVAFLNARAAGIFVAASAGNSGPGAETVGSPADAPWLTSAGNSTHDRVYANGLVNMAGGGSPPANMSGTSFTSGYGLHAIVHASSAGDGQCLNPFPAGTWTNGEIVVCDRGTIARVDKGANVLAGGAGGLVLANLLADGESTNSDPHFLPAIHLGYTDSEVLRTWLASGTGHQAQITPGARVLDPAFGDILSSSSSRGANRAAPDIIKPDVSAPGSSILAAHGVGDPMPPVWGFLSGTSMASPHLAGLGALIKDLHPAWTPAEIQSAIMSTAAEGVVKEDGVTPSDPFDRGAGRADASAAAQAGLVLDETLVNYQAADPALGGDPKTLNLASLGNSFCPGTCSWTRTVRSTAASSVVWSAAVQNPPGWQITVTPASFSLAPGATRTLTIAATATAVPPAHWAFGQVALNRVGGPAAVFPVAVGLIAPAETVYQMTTNATDPLCDTPFGGYVDLEALGIFPDPGVSGDTALWTAFGGGLPISFYGVEYPDLSFSDDGFVVFDPANNYGGTPWVPQTLPDPPIPNNLAAMLWSDLQIVYDAATNRGVSLAVAGDQLVLVEYDDPIPFVGGPSVGDFEIILRRTVDNTPGVPEIVFAYDNVNVLLNPTTVGVEDVEGAKATTLVNNASPTPTVSSGLIVCYDAQPGGCRDYVSLDSGTVTTSERHDARIGIFAGGTLTVATGGTLELRTEPGGSVHLYSGFRVQDGGRLIIGNDAPVCL